MGFFAEFNAWLTRILATYISDNTARMAAVLEPTIVTLAILYVVIWGYLISLERSKSPSLPG